MSSAEKRCALYSYYAAFTRVYLYGIFLAVLLLRDSAKFAGDNAQYTVRTLVKPCTRTCHYTLKYASYEFNFTLIALTSIFSFDFY